MARKSRVTAPPNWSIFVLLAALTFTVFGQAASHSFLNYDDGQFVYENADVRSGLTPSSIGWALTSTSYGWYPLTWLSHMLDVELWSLNAGMHLLTSVLLHSLSASILYVALQRMTGDRWRSATVAALFAVHPTHVESVVWVSERKDTLSTLFAMIALLIYATAPRRHVLLFVAMALSLMAKQMYITLPFVFLLLDFWPLRRPLNIKEKIPLFALAIFGAIMAVVGQRSLSAMQTMQAVPFGARLANAIVAYVRYIGKFFVPTNLAILYPFEPIAATTVVAAAILLLTLSAAAFVFRRSAPYFFTGWFWFVGTLVPVIGIVQIGAQAIADRYTYFSYIGLFIAVVWGARVPDRILAAVATVVIIVLAAMSYHQVRYWKDTDTLFTHTLAITPANPLAEYSLGQALELSDPDRAIEHLQKAIALERHTPGVFREWRAQVYVGLGTAMMTKARPLSGPHRTAMINDAVTQFQRALTIDPNAPHARNNILLAQRWLSGQ